jgi:hypothetical protein
MQTKRIIWLCAAVGGWLGSYTPLLWGVGTFSMTGIIFGGVGSLLGIWVGFKLTR